MNRQTIRDWKQPQPIDGRNSSDSLSPMSDGDISVIETELGIIVPQFLARWFKGDSNSGIIEMEFPLSRDKIIRENIRFRRDGYYGADWNDPLLWIGDDGGGGAYFAYCSLLEDRVYYVDWEEGDGSAVGADWSEAYSFTEYLAVLKENL